MGDLQQEKESHEFALDEIFGPKHVKVADIYKNLGAVHIDQHKSDMIVPSRFMTRTLDLKMGN